MRYESPANLGMSRNVNDHLNRATDDYRNGASKKSSKSGFGQPVGDALDYVAGSIRPGLNPSLASCRCAVSNKCTFVPTARLWISAP